MRYWYHNNFPKFVRLISSNSNYRNAQETALYIDIFSNALSKAMPHQVTINVTYSVVVFISGLFPLHFCIDLSMESNIL